MNKEIWRIITQYPKYEASTLGRIRYRPDLSHHNAKPIRKATLDKRSGYFIICMNICNNRTQNEPVGRLVLNAFVGPCPSSKYECAHWDGNKSNNKLSNLRWATRIENQRDILRHGRRPLKVVDAEVATIRHLYAQGMSTRQLARQFGIGKSTVHCYVTNQSRTYLPHVHSELPIL